MRTMEERKYLIHKHTDELKHQQQKRRQYVIDAVSLAACLIVLIGLAAFMPEQMAAMSGLSVEHISGAASILGNHEKLGYIVIAIFSFFLGMSVTVLLYRLRRRNECSQRKGDADEF